MGIPIGKLISFGKRIVGAAEQVQTATDAVAAAKDRIKGKDRAGLDQIGVEKVRRGAIVALGGNAIGVTLFTVCIETGLFPSDMLATMPTSAAVVIGVFGAIGSVGWNAVRKALAKYPNMAAQIDAALNQSSPPVE